MLNAAPVMRDPGNLDYLCYLKNEKPINPAG